jgi:hypothetical protein
VTTDLHLCRLSRILAGFGHPFACRARQGRLRRRRAELWLTIPAYSADPYRYREVIMAAAEAAAAGDGPVTRTELNEALVAAYPEWFREPGVKPGTLQQRRCRARKAIWRLLAAVLGPDDLRY